MWDRLRSWSQRNDDGFIGYKGLAILLVIVPLAVAVFYARNATPSSATSAEMGVLFSALAPFAFGGLAGFLFGIPRTLTSDAQPLSAAVGEKRKNRQAVNTNLEQISDWLTKILVGVGLTQVASMADYTRRLAKFAAAPLGATDAAVTVVAFIIIYFLVAGFMTGYLMTRLVLAPVFDVIDNGPSDSTVKRIIVAGTVEEPPGASRPLPTRDAKEVLQYKFSDLDTKSERLAWAIAKYKAKAYEDAVLALDDLRKDFPSDPAVIESYMLAALYTNTPSRVIDAGTAYLGDRQLESRDGKVASYMSLAYGQMYTKNKRDREEAGKQDAMENTLAWARKAISLDGTRKQYLKYFADPKNKDEDLIEAAADSEELRALLGR